MKSTNEILESLGEGYGYIQQIINKRIDYLKLEAAETASTVISALITLFILMFMGITVLGFATIAIAMFIGRALDNYALAFLIITGFYLLITIIVYMLRHKLITNPVLTMVISKFFESEDDNS